tara:strand:+ start:4162 stop:4389 length:228 start_codon:yes stop_codon:yes gene_type:complete
MTEKELRKQIRKEVRETLAEENIITKVLGKLFDGMTVAAQKRALKKLAKSDFYKDIQSIKGSPATKNQLDILKNL